MDLREMELRDTVEMMNSADYKERFKRNTIRQLFVMGN